jgi:acyl-coenzyme A synthetase/AMP-(fatty) acid ligase
LRVLLVVVWIDAIPRTHTGKVQCDRLQAMAQAPSGAGA